MHKFALIRLNEIKGKITFFKLEINGKCEFDEFCAELENAGEKKVLFNLFATMDSIANLKYLPQKKVRELKGRKRSDKIKDYEIKKVINGVPKRIYLFKDDNGDVIVFGSSKINQKEDIQRLRRIKLEYYNSL